MKKLALIGTKEFSQQIIEFANKTHEFEFVGFFDDLVPKGEIIVEKPVWGKVEEAIRYYQKGIFDCIFIGVGYTRFDLREYYYNLLKGKIPFANIIMPNVSMGENVTLGEGVFIGSDSCIGDNTIIRNNVFIHGSTCIGHENIVGDHTYISGRFNTAGFVEMGKKNFYGICSIISDHITICDDVWIGLGCIVAQDIKEPGKYMNKVKLYKIE